MINPTQVASFWGRVLSLGSQVDNVEDAIKKGRWHNQLNEEQELKAVELYQHGFSEEEVGRQLGVGRQCIRRVLRQRKTEKRSGNAGHSRIRTRR